MSQMESKKLQTFLVKTPLGVTGLYGNNAQQAHDARMAHELWAMLEAIVSNIPEDLLLVHAELRSAVARTLPFLED